MLQNLSIGYKMILTFLVVIALTAVIGVFAIVQNNRLATIVGQTAGSDIPNIHSITQMEGFVGSHRRGEMLMLLITEQGGKDKYVRRNITWQTHCAPLSQCHHFVCSFHFHLIQQVIQ